MSDRAELQALQQQSRAAPCAAADEALIDEIARAALQGAREPLPARLDPRHGRQNIAVLVAQVIAWATTLSLLEWSLATLSPVWRIPTALLLVVFFCTLMQGVFSLMHEYFHRLAHPSRRVNEAIGQLASLLFVTSGTLHRINHWSHHVRNRTPAEMGEYYFPSESRLGKTVLYYFAVLGGLYLAGILVPILSIVIPYRVVAWLIHHPKRNTYTAAFEYFEPATWNAMRRDAVVAMLFWAGLLLYGPWSATTLGLAYGAFAVSWSSLQWVYHLRTPIDVVEGAYNLRVPMPVRRLILNFNCNLTHHRRPHLPWQALYAATDQRETQPMWYRWLMVLLPPEPFPDEPAQLLGKRYF